MNYEVILIAIFGAILFAVLFIGVGVIIGDIHSKSNNCGECNDNNNRDLPIPSGNGSGSSDNRYAELRKKDMKMSYKQGWLDCQVYLLELLRQSNDRYIN